jgi:O-antigen/teichoic acid export membrane protein
MREDAEASMKLAGPGRLQRLLGGWSASLVQLVLGVTQQLALVPIFLHYTSRDLLAAWLALYAAGNLALVADFGLQPRAINRFLALKGCADSDGRSAQFFAGMRRAYTMLILALVAVTAAGGLLHPAELLGFQATADFDLSFVIMASGMLLLLPSNLATALYRARGLYARSMWFQCAAMLIAQIAQAIAIMATGRLVVVVLAFIVPQVMAAFYLLFVDASRCFPFLSHKPARAKWSWRWIAGQFRRAFPFAIAGSTEIVLQNLPVLIVSAFVVERVAVAQWGLTRVVAGLVRALCVQAALPIAAELGHDRAVGAKDALRRLYARGSVLVALLASLAVSGLLAFWEDFFALWTGGAVPHDLLLTLTLLIGAELVSPAILALNYSYYSDRGALLARTKGLQLASFVILALLLTPLMGPLGTALAVVATDLVVQFGLLGLGIIRETLQRPARHVLFLVILMIVVTACGWGLGLLIRGVLPLAGLGRFVAEAAIWLLIVLLAASPLLNGRLRTWLAGLIPG